MASKSRFKVAWKPVTAGIALATVLSLGAPVALGSIAHAATPKSAVTSQAVKANAQVKAQTMTVTRFAGANRMETAYKIALAQYPNGVDTAIIVSGANENLVDALTAAPLAKAYGAPILLTRNADSLDVTATYLSDLKVKNVVLVGAAGALKDQIPAGITVTKVLQGANRYDTAVQVAQEVQNKLGNASQFFVASGDSRPGSNNHLVDALAAGPWAAQWNAPILLVNSEGELSEAQRALIDSSDKTYVIGYAASFNLGLPNVTSIQGNNRYDTAAQLNMKLMGSQPFKSIVLADGEDGHYVDALAAAPFAAAKGAALVLVNNSTGNLSTSTVQFLDNDVTNNATLYVAGGTGVVSDTTVNAVKNLGVAPWGAPAALTAAADSTQLVANGKSTTTITVKVTDANGNVVGDYNGKATLDLGQANNAFALATPAQGQASDVSGTTLTITNGVGTVVVVAGTVPGINGKLAVTSGDVKDANGNLVSTSVNLSTVEQQATSIQVKPENPYVATNSTGSATFDVYVFDQTGNPMLTGSYGLTASVSGAGATFTDGKTSGEPVYVDMSTGNNAHGKVTVTVPQGQTGSVTLTVTGQGLTSGSGSVTATIAQSAAKLVVSTNQPTSITQGSGSIPFTVSSVDPNGVPTGAPSGHNLAVVITDANGKAFANATVTPSSGAAVTYDSADGYYPINTASSFTVSVGTGGAYAGNYQLKVIDLNSSQALAASAPVSFAVTPETSVSQLWVGADKNVLTATGSTVSTTVTVQLEDQYGNPIAGNGDSITLSATGGKGKAAFSGQSLSATPSVTLKADSTGKVTTTFTAQSYDASTWAIQATDMSATSTPSSTLNVYLYAHPVASYGFSLQDTLTKSLTTATAGDTVSLVDSAGKPAALDEIGLDSNGNTVAAEVADKDTVTVSIKNPKGLGLSVDTTIYNASLDPRYDVQSDTLTLTGPLSTIDSALDQDQTTSGLQFNASTAGIVTVTINDNSTGATGSASLHVLAQSTPKALALPTFASPTTVISGQPTAFTVQLTDRYGNPVVAPSDVTVKLDGSTAVNSNNNIASVEFRTSSNGSDTTSVTIPKGQSSVTVYLVATLTSGQTSGTIPADGITASSDSYTAVKNASAITVNAQ